MGSQRNPASSVRVEKLRVRVTRRKAWDSCFRRLRGVEPGTSEQFSAPGTPPGRSITKSVLRAFLDDSHEWIARCTSFFVPLQEGIRRIREGVVQESTRIAPFSLASARRKKVVVLREASRREKCLSSQTFIEARTRLHIYIREEIFRGNTQS